ncbi:MAG: hypothetical protein COV67_01500 [Nitrospinae bacterium CG11_big_fil_rev_8_21_14_0_20_56_8]|nr:MAG: hypothetical protein COV67_01500 [Nitrospinae bacterium CG11_big_fil_rev_8_21_14_0_20_56_8]
MENYPKRFIKAGLIYFVVGVLLGIVMSVEPSLGGKLRFVHIHLNLLGFMTMMIAGVAYHVLPRFSARPIPWPEGVKYHFILQNVGLVGMILFHSAGGAWKGGIVQILFVLSSVTAAVSIGLMFYNLYFVLEAPRIEPAAEISPQMKVGEVLNRFPQLMPVFIEQGFTALANPAARSTLAKFVTLEKACEKHGVDCPSFVSTLNNALREKPAGHSLQTQRTAPARSWQTEGVETTHPSGMEIRRGEHCRPDTLVGSLIKVYPTTRPVFEKHYGEGCFSCPGQAFEKVEETAHMHNIDPILILGDINAAIDLELRGGDSET